MDIAKSFTRMAALTVCLGFGLASQVQAQNAREVNYAKAASWIIPAPQPTGTQSPTGAAFQIDYSDTQVRAINGGTETYSDYRVKILKPNALAFGNLTLTWQPDGGSVTVHSVKIIRDGATIDVLEKSKFRVIEREQNLDQASLDGLLSAVLQVPGLQVGDTLELSATIVSHDQTLGDLAFGLGQLPTSGMTGAFRYRLIWPTADHLSWQTTKDLAPTVTHTADGLNEINLELRDPKGSILTDGAPPRYNVRRLIEFTGFDGWSDLSKRMYPLFDRAATLGATSPVQAEIDRIKAQSADPATRMQLALALVEDRIRYVYVGLDGGNYRPANIDETWERKYGDCKSKTALLLAILRGLGIPAEAVLVNAAGGDGIDEWLANPVMFNHVLVRAHIGDKAYWLDGTRIGDTRLDQIPPPYFRWALPLRAAGAPLEKVEPEALTLPQTIPNIDIDARAGLDVPAKVTYQTFYHGDLAQGLKMKLEAMVSDDATQSLKSSGNSGGEWNTLDAATWHFDDAKNVLIISFTGTWHLDWETSQGSARSYSLPGGGFYPPDERHRAAEQDQTAPWVRKSFPDFTCSTTTIHLPQSHKGWIWAYEAKSMNRRLAGEVYWRAAGQQGDTVRVVLSRNVYLPEITAVEAKAVNALIPTFNNLQSSVYEVPDTGRPSIAPMPFGDNADWDDLSKSCTAH